jgi:translation initiation factor IF-2
MQKIIGDSARPQQNVGPNASPAAQPHVNTGAAAAGISRPATANVAAQPAMANKPAGQNGSPAVARPGWNRFGSDVAENRGDVAIRDQGSSKTADTTSRNNAQPKPQAGTAPRSAPANATRPGWHSFGSGNANANENRGRMNSQGNAVQRPNAAPATDMGTAAPAKAPARLSNDGQRNGGWQHFTPAEPAPRSESRGVSAPSGTPRGNAPAEEVRGGGWQRFTPRSEASPSMNPRSEVSPRSSGSERPPLDLRQPIVTRRSSPAVESGPRSAYGPGGMSRPSGYSRPAGGSSMGAPAPRSGGAPASHPGGGRPSGGGGAHPGASNSGGRPH